MKGLLVIGMILAHALQLLSKPKGFFWLFSTSINLITFSGFFFCFGYVFYLSYLSNSLVNVRKKLAKTAWKSLLAYYLSGFSAYLLLSPRFLGKPYPLSFNELFQLATYVKVAWYSEFLLTFFLITLLVLIFFNWFKQLANSPLAMLCLGIGCLVTAVFLPNNLVTVLPLSLFVGTDDYAIFPLVQYLPIFLTGLYFSKYKIVWNRVVLALGLTGTSLFIGYYGWNRAMPDSFLPSIFWLVGSYGILYGYFLVAKWLEQQSNPFGWLLSIGRNTLFYLVLSNFILFALSNHIQTRSEIAFLIGGIVLLVIGFLISLLAQSTQPKYTSDTLARPHSNLSA